MTAEFMQPDLMPALPEMVMLAMTCLVLVVDLFLPQEKRGFTLLLSVVTLGLAIGAVIVVAPCTLCQYHCMRIGTSTGKVRPDFMLFLVETLT